VTFVRDDELVEMFQQFLPRFRLRIEQRRIGSAQHVHVRQNSSLRRQEERIAPRSRRELFNVIACGRRARSSPVARILPRTETSSQAAPPRSSL
jgi:hypothetical protein